VELGAWPRAVVGLVGALFVLIVASGALASLMPAGQEVARVSPQQLRQLLDNPTARPWVLDVRPHAEYLAGHLAGAVSLPGAEVATRIDELPRDRLIVAYCQ